MSLSYQYGEVGEDPVLLNINSSVLTIPYVLTEGTQAGDIAQIQLTSEKT